MCTLYLCILNYDVFNSKEYCVYPQDYLREAGEVTYADAHKHRRNEGVVDFASYDDMKRAIDKLNDTEINGRRIKLIEDRGSRSSSRGRSQSRSRSRSRSRSDRDSRSRSR